MKIMLAPKIKYNSCNCNKLDENEILSELAESRRCYENGEGEDFDLAIDEIGVRYGL